MRFALFSGGVRIAVGALIALPTGRIFLEMLGDGEVIWNSWNYVVALCLGILPFTAGIALIWAGWVSIKERPSPITAIATVASIALIALSITVPLVIASSIPDVPPDLQGLVGP